MISTFWQWIAALGCVLGCFILYSKYFYRHFERHGIKSIIPSIPIFGNLFWAMIQKENFGTLMVRIYNKFPEERYVGVFEFTRRVIMLRDIELIKTLCIRDFDHFTDHRRVNEDDSMFSKHLFALQGQRWKDMRSTLSPAFTSSKMRSMFGFVVECAEESAKFYKKECRNSEKGLIDLEMKETFMRYSNDVIATCAFGLKINSLEDRNNEFLNKGKSFTNLTFLRVLRILGYNITPKLMKFFRIALFDEDLTSFFRTLVQGTMKEREENNIIREDMIHLLMETKKGSLKHDKQEDKEDSGFATAEDYTRPDLAKKDIKWSDDELTAQALLFFIAGFETSSTLLSFVAHELAANPDIQKKAHNEIDEVKSGLTGKLTYNDLHKLKYMDMVISETLRYWPPVGLTDRLCVKPYFLPPAHDGGMTFQLNSENTFWVPIYAIQHDSQYFPNPEKFDPERFSDENKGSIKPYTYLPFGIGPRNCIGSRFALMEVKAILFYLLADFEFLVTAKTEIPLKMSNTSASMKPKNGFWIALNPRNSSINQ